MFKRQIIKVVISLALSAVVTGSTSLVADSFGVAVISQVHACSSGGSSGGGC